MEEQTKELSLEEKFKSHIHFEGGMDDSLLSFYLDMAKDYVKTATGGQQEYLAQPVYDEEQWKTLAKVGGAG